MLCVRSRPSRGAAQSAVLDIGTGGDPRDFAPVGDRLVAHNRGAFPNRPLAPGPATEPALSSDLGGTVAYWLDGAGTPQVASL